MLRKNVYPYEYMDEWEKFNEISLSEKEYFYKKINMEDITDADYTQKEFVKNLKKKILVNSMIFISKLIQYF